MKHTHILLAPIGILIAFFAVVSDAHAYRYAPGSEQYAIDNAQRDKVSTENRSDFVTSARNLEDQYAQRSSGVVPSRLQASTYDVLDEIDTTRFDRDVHSGAPLYGSVNQYGKGVPVVGKGFVQTRSLATERAMYRRSISPPPPPPPMYDTVYPPAYMGYTIERGVQPPLYDTGLEHWILALVALGGAAGLATMRRRGVPALRIFRISSDLSD